jgi:SAM-dependent methyltransferase
MPASIEGFPAFAPELATQNNGYDSRAHRRLDELQESSFWFRGRNKLLQFALTAYFPQAKNMMEIGCGTGYVLSGVSKIKPGMRLTGAEIHLSGLQLARARLPEAELIQMDARKIPFAHEFDVIGIFDVLEHIEEDAAVLREMHRALKADGGLILTVPQHRWLWSKVDEISYHERRYSREELTMKVETAGFKVIWATSFVTFLLPFIVLSRLRWRPGTDTGKGLDEVINQLKMPSVINYFFEKVYDLEIAFLVKGLPFPAGGSLLVVAVKE